VIRKRIQLAPEKAIYIFVDEVLPPTAAMMAQIYEDYKDEDGFLYVTYSGENVGELSFHRSMCANQSSLCRLSANSKKLEQRRSPVHDFYHTLFRNTHIAQSNLVSLYLFVVSSAQVALSKCIVSAQS
jgi:hypothetical protein